MRKTVYILVVFLAVAAVSLPGCKKPTAGWGDLSGRVTSSAAGEPMEGVVRVDRCGWILFLQ